MDIFLDEFERIIFFTFWCEKEGFFTHNFFSWKKFLNGMGIFRQEMWWAVFCQNIIPTSGMFPVLVTRFKKNIRECKRIFMGEGGDSSSVGYTN